jgi:hypothetical protein
VLRVLIGGAALALLKIPVTAAMVEQFVRSQMRLRAITGFREEVESNARTLERWTSPLEPGEAASRHLRTLEHEHLATAWAVDVLDLLDTEYLRERDLRQITDRYLECVRALNAQIDSFTEQNALIGESADHTTAAIRFWTEQRDTETFGLIVGMPRQVEVIGRVEQILANPCHVSVLSVLTTSVQRPRKTPADDPRQS